MKRAKAGRYVIRERARKWFTANAVLVNGGLKWTFGPAYATALNAMEAGIRDGCEFVVTKASYNPNIPNHVGYVQVSGFWKSVENVIIEARARNSQ